MDNQSEKLSDAAFIYLWTSLVPKSEERAIELRDNELYREVFTVICVDNPQIRNYLMYSTKATVTEIPCYLVMINGQILTYSPDQFDKVKALIDSIYVNITEEFIPVPTSSSRLSSRSSSRASVRSSSRASSRSSTLNISDSMSVAV
jgi:hypothetical protein